MTQAYLFAHRFLPQLVFSEPSSARRWLGQQGFLRKLWAHAGMHARHGEPRPFPDALTVTTEGDRTFIVLPSPEEPPDAHSVAIVWNQPTPDFYVMELGDRLDGNATYYLCGWTADGNHSNYGEGYKPDLESFRRALDERL